MELGCTALQIFTQAPGRWRGKPIDAGDAVRFRRMAADAGLEGAVLAHAPYLINVASRDPELWERSVELLADQLRRAAMLGLAGVVLHPGAHGGAGPEEGVERAAEGIARALELVPDGPPVLVETTAGQGTVLGASLEEIGAILERLPAGRAGVCWDTAHLWGAGWEITRARVWEALWREHRRRTGRPRPDAVHLNDTNVEPGSRRDRHERIGHGRLGCGTFARIVCDARLRGTPLILETPKGPDEVSWDREALELLRGLARSC